MLPRAMKKQQCPVRPLSMPRTFPKLSFAFIVRFKLGARAENVLPLPSHKNPAKRSQAPDPAPNFFKMVLRISAEVQVGSLSGKRASHPAGHQKSTMSRQALDLATNFSKIAFCFSVKVQVWSMNGKCAPLIRAIKNQQCPVRPPTQP